MFDGGEFFTYRASNTLRRRVERDQIRVAGLQLGQFSIEGVVGVVADDRIVQHVIPVQVVIQLPA